jgi:hypothetical protein
MDANAIAMNPIAKPSPGFICNALAVSRKKNVA